MGQKNSKKYLQKELKNYTAQKRKKRKKKTL